MWGYKSGVPAYSGWLLLTNPSTKVTLPNTSDNELLCTDDMTVGTVLSILNLERLPINALQLHRTIKSSESIVGIEQLQGLFQGDISGHGPDVMPIS